MAVAVTVRVWLPAGGALLIGVVGVVVLPPQAVRVRASAVRSTVGNKWSEDLRRRVSGRRRSAVKGIANARAIPRRLWERLGNAKELTVEATLMVAMEVVGLVPVIAAGAVTLQVIQATGLVQVRLTEPVKPPAGVRVMVSVALEPGLMGLGVVRPALTVTAETTVRFCAAVVEAA